MANKKTKCVCNVQIFKGIGLEENISVFASSNFYPLLAASVDLMKAGQKLREISNTLVLHLCKNYFEEENKFYINDRTSISFCAREVSEVLGGITCTGAVVSEVKDNKFPEYVENLKKLYSTEVIGKEKTSNEDRTTTNFGKTKRELSNKSLKNILRSMVLDTEEKKIQYKTLLLCYVVDKLLMPSSDTSFVRSSIFGLVQDLEKFENTNWAQTALNAICEAAVKAKLTYSGPGPVLEVSL